MYIEALAQNRILCSEKMVLKLGLVLMALAIFSTPNMSMSIYDTGSVLKGYIQENTMLKEQSDDALFLLQKKWDEDLNAKYPKTSIKKIDEGIVYIPLVKYVNSRRVKINVAEINRNINQDIEIIPQMSLNKMHSKSKINNIASQNNALLAINGSYFKQDTGTALGALVIDNEIISGPIYERVGLGIENNGFKTSRIAFEGSLKKASKQIKLDNINQPRMMFSQVLLYNSKWGTRAPAAKKPEVYISVLDNKIINKSNLPLYIPQGGYVISAPQEILVDFKVGDKVEINYKLNPEWENVNHIISGGPYLLKEGKTYIDVTNEKLTGITGRNPRTAIGYTKENVMIMVTVDGRKEGSSGVTLNELASLMKSFGCYEAINLDGGSSTVMYVNGTILTGSNIKNSVAVSNALVVRRRV